MRRALQTAVAAVAAPDLRRSLPALLADAGVRLLRMDRNANDAWKSLTALRPELFVVDAGFSLPGGAELALRASRSLKLPLRPAVLALRWPMHAEALGAELTAAGAILWENIPESAEFLKAVEQLRCAPPAFLPEEIARTERLLDALGVPEHAGRKCLKFAALICAADVGARHALGKRVYPLAGELCHLTAAQAERAMRFAIGRAWQSDKFENQYRIFADTVDAARGQPTCGEMISRLADILQSEG